MIGIRDGEGKRGGREDGMREGKGKEDGGRGK